jgi:peptide/nickel transport system substrate-binding protein
MVKLARRSRVALGLMATFALALTACGKSSTRSSSNNAARTLVIDKSFDLKTADPGGEFEVSGGIIVHALYDTLLTFEGSDVTKPVPSLAESYQQSADGKSFTFKLRSGVKFSDNTPLTAGDVAFSLNRVRNLKGNPSFLLKRAGLRARDFEPVAASLRADGVAAAARLVTPAMLEFGIAGGPDDVLARCRWLRDQGATHLSFGPPLGPDPLAAVETLALQVLPRLAA